MSYAQIKEDVYRVYQPDTPWHPGAPGWTSAPIPGWGQNPNLLDTYKKAVQGLGCGTGGCCGGCRATSGVDSNVGAVVGVVVLLGLAVGLTLASKG